MSDTSAFEPTPEHIWLTEMIGEWDVECAYTTIPGEEPLTIPGHEVVQSLGPFWIAGRFEADMLGTPLVGQSATGYDPIKKLFVATWKDSHTPYHYRFEGTRSKDGNLLELAGENYDPTRGRLSTYRSRTEFEGVSERVLSLTVEVDGEELPILEYRYKRK